MKSKSQEILDALAAGDVVSALRIAAHFHDRSADTLTYKRGLDAQNHPDFYRQLGRNPGEIADKAIALLRKNSWDRNWPVGTIITRRNPLQGWEFARNSSHLSKQEFPVTTPSPGGTISILSGPIPMSASLAIWFFRCR